ncbi:Retrovirus-related Pol polyprotein from transposon TNT 1-94 [Vitis vinifera]|uniref:Retrovirus-related Pol polyprotein from transposon TNT 1-94 n=1 Tax=Vitis vinifera TaxID=29760 RepID=A0A438H680_VITVI|nr:Retrovirus-related Pol polyprotein from transposon TNT 1-94 [Vitis vinifera]
MIVLQCMDLDYALREDHPTDLTGASIAKQRVAMEKWERSNCMSLIIMKHSIPEAIRGAIPEKSRAKTFLDQIANRFAANEKGHGTNKKRKRNNKGKQTAYYGTSEQKVQKKQDKEITCFFCKKVGHMKKACTKYAIWRLGHISNQRIQRLVSKRILDPLDLSDFQVCIECIKGKQTNVRKKYANRCGGVLEFIHTDICGPFPTPSWNGQQYFITFIDDYSRYDYLYLIHEKSQSLDVFKNFKVEVENQLGKKIKAVKSDRGGEYYGRYDGSGEQCPRPFAKYLMKYDIAPQYTIPGVLQAKMGCLVEARPYKPNEKKLDSRTVSYYFVGYSEMSRGFKFYDPSTRSFFEMGNAKFIEDVELSRRESLRNVVFEEESVSIPIIATGHGHIMFDDTIQNVQPITEIVDTPEIHSTQVVEPVQVHEEVTQEPQVQVSLKRSTREMRSTISDDYVVYLQEHEFDMGLEDDPISVSQVKQSSNSEKWIKAMKNEMKSMKDNGVWDLVELPEGVKPIGYKWIFKTKRDSKGNIVRYKARLVAKGFTQNECIDYKETFSPVSSNDSFRIIMTLMAHYDLELHQMGVKTAFLNAYLYKRDLKSDNKGVSWDGGNELCGRWWLWPDKADIATGLVGSLMYAQVCTHSDIAYIVGMLGRYLSNPGMDHWKKAKRVTCRRSTSGYIFMLAGKAVLWKSVKQTLIDSFTMKAKFIAYYETSNHGIWLWNFITELHIVDGIEKPLRINYDNKAAELYSKNNRSSSKSKHIDFKFLVVKEKVQSLQVSIEHISTNFIIANPLTKGLPPKTLVLKTIMFEYFELK